MGRTMLRGGLNTLLPYGFEWISWMCLTIPWHWSLSIPHENIRKPEGIERDQWHEMGF